MSQNNPPPFGGRNTVSSEDERLAANPASTAEDDNISLAGSVDDQNNLIERNLLPGEVEGLADYERHEKQQKKSEKLQNETSQLAPANSSSKTPSHFDIFGEQIQTVTDIQLWSQSVVNWVDFNTYDRDAASARQDPIKSSAIDWLLSLSPKKQLDSTYLGQPRWVTQGWGGYPNLGIEVKRELLVAIDAPEGMQFDSLLVDHANLGIAWPDAGSPGSPYKPSELRGRPSLKHYNTRPTRTLEGFHNNLAIAFGLTVTIALTAPSS